MGGILAERVNDKASSREFEREAQDFQQALEHNLDRVAQRIGSPAIPASPYRRLDAGAIGSLAGGYPLQLQRPDDPKLLATVEFLMENCFFGGGFFQDMIHSGMNAYLTLHVAQVLLRTGDPRFRDLMTAVAGMASPTGQWPGGDTSSYRRRLYGRWTARIGSAEWMLMIRHCFLREEEESLIMGAGIFPAWLAHDETLSFGPAPTVFGTVSMTLHTEKSATTQIVSINWQGVWHRQQPPIEIRLPILFPTAYCPMRPPRG